MDGPLDVRFGTPSILPLRKPLASYLARVSFPVYFFLFLFFFLTHLNVSSRVYLFSHSLVFLFPAPRPNTGVVAIAATEGARDVLSRTAAYLPLVESISAAFRAFFGLWDRSHVFPQLFHLRRRSFVQIGETRRLGLCVKM